MIKAFGRLPDGRGVQRIAISGGGLTARLLTWGAVLQDLRLAGHRTSLTLGLATLDDYLDHSRNFGATAGRCANRIGGARFDLDGRTHQLDANFGDRHHLHGGRDGLGRRLWGVRDRGADFVTLASDLPDGHMGYPGALSVEAHFRLEGGALDIRYRATTTAASLCNLAHHSYWVLDDSGTVLDHDLWVGAQDFTAIDGDLIPTGEVAPVAGTHLDFSHDRPLRDGSTQAPVDHNFAVAPARRPIAEVARLTSRASGLRLTVRSTEPGLQVYDAGPMDVPVLDIDGRALTAHAGLALEPQVWPDAIHHAGFPSPVLRPGETYDQHTRFEIERVN